LRVTGYGQKEHRAKGIVHRAYRIIRKSGCGLRPIGAIEAYAPAGRGKMEGRKWENGSRDGKGEGEDERVGRWEDRKFTINEINLIN